MVQQTINIGAAPDDGTGDTLRVGGDKINDNFTELYAADAALGTAAALDIDTDDTLAADSDSLIPTQQAVKAYVDAAVGGPAITELDDVPDVNAPTPSNGDVLTWDSTPGEWVASPPAGGTFDLDDATDVNAPSPSNGDVLTWDSTPGEWVAAAPSGSTEWTLVDSDTASASATVDLSVDTSTFNEWKLVGHDVVLSAGNELALQLGSGGGPTWDTGNNYDFGIEWRYGTSGVGTFSRAYVSATANMRLGTVASASSASGVPLDFECTLKYLASGKNARIANGTSSYDGGGGLTRLLFDGVHLNAAYTTTGLRILPSAGTITSGKFLLYGRTR